MLMLKEKLNVYFLFSFLFLCSSPKLQKELNKGFRKIAMFMLCVSIK